MFPADAREQARRFLLNDGFNDFYAGIFCQPAAFLNLEITLINTQDEMLLHYPATPFTSVTTCSAESAFIDPASASAFPKCGRVHEHPFYLGRCEVLPFPREALLVRLEVRNALSDFVAL